MAIEDATVNLSCGTFRYRHAGNPALRPVILLHALSLDSTDWDGVMLSLSDRFHVLALDQRGHGRSARTAAYSFGAMCTDVLEFADALGIGHFHLIGHSMGGTVAFLAAETYPARIETLVIEDSPPPVGGTSFPEPPEEPPAPVPFDWAVVRAIVGQLNRPDPAWWARLPDVTARTLVIGGGPTSHVPQTLLPEVVARMKHAQLLTIDGAGHYVHSTKPTEFVAAVRAFLP